MAHIARNISKAREEIAANLLECCEEVLAWRKTGLLGNGHLRRIGDQYMEGDLRQTEDQVVRLALEAVAKSQGSGKG